MQTIKMRAALSAGLVVIAAAGGAARQDRGNDVMAQVREALGGEQKLAAVKSFSLRATYQREMSMPAMTGGARATVTINGGPAGGGSPQVTGEIEVDADLPGKFIKVDTSTGFMAMTRTEGFEGDRPFVHAAAANPGMRIMIDRPADDPQRARQTLQRNQSELGRLLLGILGSTQASLPVTYTHAGVAESPDGKAEMIDVKGPADFAARLFVDVQTHLPLMLTYMAPEPRVIMRTADRSADRPPANEAAERDRLEKERLQAEAAAPKFVEYRMFFADYRNVGGLSLPHRIARGTAQKTTEEWEVKSYSINPTFKADRFKVS
jgi:hypothetical protein